VGRCVDSIGKIDPGSIVSETKIAAKLGNCWMKMKALSEGARLASAWLWGKATAS
jgi:hypothetical protein